MRLRQVLAAATSTVALASACTACGSSSRPAPATAVDGGRQRMPTGAATLAPLPRGTTTLSLPTGPPIALDLPDGATALVDHTGERPEIVVSIPTATLGFSLGQTIPLDPAGATDRLDGLIAALEASGRLDLAHLEVTGFASAEGDPQRNQALSEGRAQWVCDALRHRRADLTIACTGAGTAADVDPPGPGPEDRRVELRAQVGRR